MAAHYTSISSSYEDFDSEDDSSLEVVEDDWLTTPETTFNESRKSDDQLLSSEQSVDLTMIKPMNSSSKSLRGMPGDSKSATKLETIHKSQYIVDNLNLFYALCEVDDWNFMRFLQLLDLLRCIRFQSSCYSVSVILFKKNL